MQQNSDTIIWAKDCLLENKYVLNAPPEIIQKTPYSSVIRFTTSHGNIYLKETPPALSMEAEIILILKEKIHAAVPKILGINNKLHCFLMLDSGIPLREYLKTHFQLNLLFSVILQYTNIQYVAIDQIDNLLKLDVLDWRLNKLPELYHQILNKEKLLLKDGVTESEYKTLEALYPTFVAICDLLSQYHIPETLNHCDFHDNNVLIDPKNNHLTLIDWGEIVLAHPFFSLISFISTTAFRYSINEIDDIFSELLDTCFKNWLNVASKVQLKEAILLTKKLWPIYSAMGYYRLIASSGMDMDETTLTSYFSTGRNAGRFAKYFKEFIKTSVDLEPSDISRVKLSDPSRTIHG